MKGIFAALVAAGMLGGCAVSNDGLGFAPAAPSASEIAKTKDQLERNAGSSAAPGEAASVDPGEAVPGILVIGTTGPFRPVAEKERAGFYSAYVKLAAQWHPGVPPSMDLATFEQKLTGWATVQTFSIPGIVSRRIRVLVPDSLAHGTRFASAGGSLVFGTTRDLVAARGDRDGLLWLERVLCRDDASYRTCAANYQSGIFDENTGQELARDRKPKPGGALVDVTSYVKLPQESAHHSASELDVREADHCDCNRALPGSAQSAVHVPEVDK